MPCSTEAELNNSLLLHRDLAAIIVSSDKNKTKRVRQEFKDAVQRHEGFSLVCGLGDFAKLKIFVSRPRTFVLWSYLKQSRNEQPLPKYGVLHVTPLLTRDGSTMAMVAIFE